MSRSCRCLACVLRRQGRREAGMRRRHSERSRLNSATETSGPSSSKGSAEVRTDRLRPHWPRQPAPTTARHGFAGLSLISTPAAWSSPRLAEASSTREHRTQPSEPQRSLRNGCARNRCLVLMTRPGTGHLSVGNRSGSRLLGGRPLDVDTAPVDNLRKGSGASGHVLDDNPVLRQKSCG